MIYLPIFEKYVKFIVIILLLKFVNTRIINTMKPKKSFILYLILITLYN